MPTTIPGADALGGVLNSANNQYGHTIAGITANEDLTGSDYGYDLTRDAAGNVTGYHLKDNVQATDPFSRAALLQRLGGQQRNQTLNSYAARGQLYSGALVNQQNTDQFSYDQNFDSLVKTLARYFTNSTQAKVQAADARDSGVSSSALQTLLAALGSTPQ